MTAFYNEIDPYAAQWLRNLISAGHIAPGVVDERSIEDIRPDELVGFTQCHFFAGIGVWSYALRQTGISDDTPVWTGSCPCQPFSAAGKGAGFADERHLWPAFQHLISQCKPPIVLGEQVASKDAGPWIDLVHTDLEALGYAFGAIPFPAASVGAPHIRDRLYWVADALMQQRPDGQPGIGNEHDARGRHEGAAAVAGLRGDSGLAHPQQHDSGRQAQPAEHRQPQADGPADRAGGCGGSSGGLADAHGSGREPGQRDDPAPRHGYPAATTSGDDRPGPAGPTNGHWRDADWLYCRDGRWRPVESGTFPLVNGATARVGRLRAFGNAIVSQAAQAFIESVM